MSGAGCSPMVRPSYCQMSVSDATKCGEHEMAKTYKQVLGGGRLLFRSSHDFGCFEILRASGGVGIEEWVSRRGLRRRVVKRRDWALNAG